MKRIILLGVICAGLAQYSMAQTNILKEAALLQEQGQFKGAAQLLTNAIQSKKYSGIGLRALEFDLDRLERIKQDYSSTHDELFNDLKQSLKGITPEEFEKWIKAGWFDAREIDGKMCFLNVSVSNLYFRHPELNSRRIKPKDDAAKEQAVLANCEAIQKAARETKTPYVLPKTFHVTMKVATKADAVPAGETIRAWVPIPRQYPFQKDFKLTASSLPPKNVDDENSPIRSIYFEQPAAKGKPTEFNIEYNFTAYGVSFDLKPEQVKPYDRNDPAVKQYTSEAPHVVFTPEIKALSAKIVGNETNPMLKAKKIYDWLGDHLLYSYSTEYSTIPNISEYCRNMGYGDCGQQALLFITLCRYNGIPARWQTGWDMWPGKTTNHDWTEINLAPYGWVPVDPYMANYAMRYITTLSQEKKLKIRDFYFGGLTQYRMSANSDHNQALRPAKQTMRSDDVDFQRGELEYGNKNLYFDKFSYKFNYKEIAPPAHGLE
ncbi:MAG: Transglutaminase domain protein [Pedosphaera sp.]|nr:Transglutaminase domain protein [Pedosphaera sp.]